MRTLPFALTLSAVFLCANAQAHSIPQVPPCDGTMTFVPVHSELIGPPALHQAYLDFMHDNGNTTCYIHDDGNPDPGSCYGVDASRFATLFADDFCRNLSEHTAGSLNYSVSLTPELDTPDESHHNKYSFAHTLHVVCGFCAKVDISDPPLDTAK